MTATQQSIFNAPVPGSAAANTSASATPVAGQLAQGAGQKRPRDEEEDDEASDSDVAMEEDSDDE